LPRVSCLLSPIPLPFTPQIQFTPSRRLLHHKKRLIDGLIDDSSTLSLPQRSEIIWPPTPELSFINLPDMGSPQPTDQLFSYGDASESPQGLLLIFGADDEPAQDGSGPLLTQAAPATHVDNTLIVGVNPAGNLQPTEIANNKPAVPAAAATPGEDEQLFLRMIQTAQLQQGIYHFGQPILLLDGFPDAMWIEFRVWFRTA